MEEGKKKIQDLSDSLCSESGENDLLETLNRVLGISGVSGDESKILDFIEQEIKSNCPNLVFCRHDDYGIYVIVPSSSDVEFKRAVLFDANVDTVKHCENEIVFVKDENNRNSEDEDWADSYEGKSRLYNRVGVAILLEMVKRIRFDRITYVAVFSTKGILGQHSSGSSYFSKNIDIRSRHDIILERVFMIDVFPRCTRSREGTALLCVFGDGFLPIEQTIGDGLEHLGNHESYLHGNTSNLPLCRFSVPIFEGQSQSFLSISDFFGLFKYIRTTFEDDFITEDSSKFIDLRKPILRGDQDIPEIEEKKKKYGDVPKLSIFPKNEEEEYLLDSYLTLLQYYGVSEEESPVLDFVKREVGKYSKDVIVHQDYTNYGIMIIVPPKNKKTANRFVLFDAHIDTVESEYVKPYRYEITINGNKKKQMIIATGHDNRIHCALLLCMIRYLRFDDLQYVVLFSVQEEIGCLGAEYFAEHVDLRSVCKSQFFEAVVVLDVTRSKYPKDEEENNISKIKSEEKESKEEESEGEETNHEENWRDHVENYYHDESVSEYYPIVGGGVVPIHQPFHNYEFMYRCNSRKFIDGKFTKDVRTIRLSLCCTNMHYRESYASVSDLYDFYDWTKHEFESYITEKRFLGQSNCVEPEKDESGKEEQQQEKEDGKKYREVSWEEMVKKDDEEKEEKDDDDDDKIFELYESLM